MRVRRVGAGERTGRSTIVICGRKWFDSHLGRVFTARKSCGSTPKDQMSHQANNIMAGTEVISLVEVRSPNGSLVHPRGAVGVVTRTPTVAG